MNVQILKVCVSFFCFFLNTMTTSTELWNVQTTFEDLHIIPRSQRCWHYTLMISTLPDLPHFYSCTLQSPKIAAQLVVRAPLVLYTSHQCLDSSTSCLLMLGFPVFTRPCFNAVTSSTSACLSDLLQLCSPSRSLHFSVVIRLLPFPPCRCRTGGDCTFSRLGLLFGTHCHSTSGM